MTDQDAKIRACSEELSRWVCRLVWKHGSGSYSFFDGSNPFEQIIRKHLVATIPVTRPACTARPAKAERIADQ